MESISGKIAELGALAERILADEALIINELRFKCDEFKAQLEASAENQRKIETILRTNLAPRQDCGASAL